MLILHISATTGFHIEQLKQCFVHLPTHQHLLRQKLKGIVSVSAFEPFSHLVKKNNTHHNNMTPASTFSFAQLSSPSFLPLCDGVYAISNATNTIPE